MPIHATLIPTLAQQLCSVKVPPRLPTRIRDSNNSTRHCPDVVDSCRSEAAPAINLVLKLHRCCILSSKSAKMTIFTNKEDQSPRVRLSFLTVEVGGCLTDFIFRYQPSLLSRSSTHHLFSAHISLPICEQSSVHHGFPIWPRSSHWHRHNRCLSDFKNISLCSHEPPAMALPRNYSNVLGYLRLIHLPILHL